MLQCLTVTDLALIGRAEIRFAPGLNVLSGATGGGKSLIITALKLLRGGRASAALVRHGAEELRVDGEFALGEGERSLAVEGVLRGIVGSVPEDGVLLVTRTVDRSGRGRVRIAGRPATLADLRALGEHLLEIHGQGDTRALMRPGIQAETLDAFAGTTALRRTFADQLEAARAARARCDAAEGRERERTERIEFLRFRIAEIDALGLQPGEIEALEAEHAVLAHHDRLRGALDVAALALQEGDPSASGLSAMAHRALADVAAIDRALALPLELIDEARLRLDEAAREIVSRRAALDADPHRLAEVEERLATLRRALRRFGPTEADLLRARAEATAELDVLEGEAADPEELARRAGAAHDALAECGRELLHRRRAAAARFARAVQRELEDLGMPDARLRVALPDALPDELLDESNAHGPGTLELEVRMNPGEPWQSLRETASGGEAARIVLAIKKCLADRDRVPFLVFDEIDAEIGGRLGLEVGRKLAAVAASHQVLIVTHLPQVAAFADAHFRVGKLVRADRTWSEVERLDRAAAERELAAMAAGDGADAEAIAEARRLVARARGSAPAGSRARRGGRDPVEEAG